MEGFPNDLVLSPTEWPAIFKDVRPGDLSKFIQQGFGLGAPAIITPYGGAAEDSYYGFHAPSAHPFLNAPLTEASGGTIYFDDHIRPESLSEMFRLMGVFSDKDYVAYGKKCEDPRQERYLYQLRLVSRGALVSLYHADDPTPPPPQSLDTLQALSGFIEAQQNFWNDNYTFSGKLQGTAGGDGDWAKESLAFGFEVENTYWGVYRIWSRPWLVTK